MTAILIGGKIHPIPTYGLRREGAVAVDARKPRGSGGWYCIDCGGYVSDRDYHIFVNRGHKCVWSLKGGDCESC